MKRTRKENVIDVLGAVAGLVLLFLATKPPPPVGYITRYSDAQIDAAVDALIADHGLPRFGPFRAGIERRQRLAFDAASRVR